MEGVVGVGYWDVWGFVTVNKFCIIHVCVLCARQWRGCDMLSLCDAVCDAFGLRYGDVAINLLYLEEC
mgnify:CR=1 FL=1